MNVLSSIFGAVVSARNALYDRGLLKSHRLAGPVISVGNVRVGGAGKTPFVVLLGELLKQRGIAFDVLSRGYGRNMRGVALVDPQGAPAEFGDEPLLIARKLGVRVIVGEDRYAAGLFAEQRFGSQLHLLDDGFQHRRLARDYDIVLLTPTDSEDTLLPTGRLREPLASLRRVDAIVLPADMPDEDLARVRERLLREEGVWGRASAPFQAALSQVHKDKLILRVHRGICTNDVPSRPVAFSAIARPERFIDDLLQAGMDPVDDIRFPDHNAYDRKDIDVLLRAAAEHQANGFVTTEKDAINLGEFASSLRPLSVVPVVATLDDADAALDQILATIADRRGTGHSPVPTP
jgi:tetraacyldisaccharide 4'-kinase